jgi:hypothetical protein
MQDISTLSNNERMGHGLVSSGGDALRGLGFGIKNRLDLAHNFLCLEPYLGILDISIW